MRSYISTIDKILILSSIFIILITIILSVIIYPRLPEIIPTHFNASMEADGYGSRNSIFVMIAFDIFTVALVIFCSFSPNLMSIPFKLNPEKLTAQQYLSSRMCRVLSIWIASLFLLILLTMSTSVFPVSTKLWNILFYITMTGLFGTCIIYCIKIYRARK